MKTYVLITATIGIAFAVIVIWLIRRDHMHVRYSLWWLTTAAVVVLLGVFPGVINTIGALLGVAYPPALFFVIALVALLFKSLLADIERSKSEKKLMRLTQRFVLLEEELRRARNQDQAP